MKKIILLLITICSFQVGFSQEIDQATLNKIKVKLIGAEKLYEQGKYYETLDKIKEIEAISKGMKSAKIQNLKVKAYLGWGLFQSSKDELDKLYKMNPDDVIIEDIASYESKIVKGIKDENARKERDDLFKINSGCISGDCNNGYGVYVYDEVYKNKNNKYKGEWKNGKKHGKGAYILSIYKFDYYGWAIFKGNWKNDLREGYGYYQTSENEIIEGTWKFGKREGLFNKYDASGNQIGAYNYKEGKSLNSPEWSSNNSKKFILDKKEQIELLKISKLEHLREILSWDKNPDMLDKGIAFMDFETLKMALTRNEKVQRDDGKYHVIYTFINFNKLIDMKLLSGSGPVNTKLRLYFKKNVKKLHMKFDYQKNHGLKAVDYKDKLEEGENWVDVDFLKLSNAKMFKETLNNLRKCCL